ncbi:hypothetical protein [Larkinella sp.]|uniref:hypothetical protein n=1 Tax=Larkinella sp. TaxID=2034517 RepID=UPI003BA9CA63
MMKALRGLGWLVVLLLGGTGTTAQPPDSVSGRVQGYLSNRIGDYDGIRLRTNAGEIRLHFPPHTAATIRRLAAAGQFISAQVEPEPPRPGPARPGSENSPTATVASRESAGGTYRIIQLKNPASGKAVRVADIPPPPPQLGRLIQIEGPLVKILRAETGQVIALLTDKYMIELKPHQGEQISALLGGVKRLGVVGYERPTDGFVNRSGRPLVFPTTLTIRGQTFAL